MNAITHEIVCFHLDTDADQLAVVCKCGWSETNQFYSGPMHAIGETMSRYVEHVVQWNRGIESELRK